MIIKIDSPKYGIKEVLIDCEASKKYHGEFGRIA